MLNSSSPLLVTDILLLDYKRCQRRAFLDIYGNSNQKSPDKDFLKKLRQESKKHTEGVVNTLFSQVNLCQASSFEETLHLMQQGVDCIYQGTLQVSYSPTVDLIGTPDLLIKQAGQSQFGDWLYYPVSIHLGRRPKPEYKLMATFYAHLLAQIQGISPKYSQIILRRQNHHSVDLTRWYPRLMETLNDCIQTLSQQNEPEVFISRQKCALCHWYNHCYQIAQDENHLSLVPGVTPNRYEALQTLGIITLELLAGSHPYHLKDIMSLEIAAQLQQQAQSILENRPILKSPLSVSPSLFLPTADIEFYFDIEAEPEQNLDYLLGILQIDRLKQTETFYPFLAETPQEEEEIWQSFLDLVTRYPLAPIFHFSEYEAETIKRLSHLYHTPRSQKEILLSRLVDLHQRVTSTVILPVESYSLKSMAKWLGFQWRDEGISGDQCVFWYDQWLKTQDRSFLSSILRYNEDDCRATFWLKEWLSQFLKVKE